MKTPKRGSRPAARRAKKTAPKKTASKSKKAASRKMKAYASFDLYLADQPPKHQRIIRALRTFVQGVAPKLEESVKWGNGCWLQGKVPISYVYAAPDYVQFGFIRGSSLKDPRGLLQGEGQYVRHVKVHETEDIDEAAFAALLRQAVRYGPPPG